MTDPERALDRLPPDGAGASTGGARARATLAGAVLHKGSRRLALQTLAIAALCILMVGALHCEGLRSRHSSAAAIPTSSAVLVATSADLYKLWRDAGARGRRLVHLSRYVHFVELADDATQRAHAGGFPIAPVDLVAHYEQQVNARSLLWMAVERGIAREVVHVLQPAELDGRIRTLATDDGDVEVDGRRLVTSERGTRRVVRDDLPYGDEPVLLSIDASYLDSDAAVTRLLDQLRAAPPRADLIALCRSDDNPDVSDKERERLQRLADLLGARAP